MPAGAARALEFERVRSAAKRAASLGLTVNAGHGLNYHNVEPIAAIAEIVELNIGHAIVARAFSTASPKAVRDMKESDARGAMIYGIGIDVLKVDRVERVFDKHGERFVAHLLMPEERAQLERTARPVRFLAMRFAAKEAIVKGMGTGFAHGVWIRDVGIVQNSWGKPEVVYSARGAKVRDGLGIGEGHVTLTDEAGLVVAVAVLMRRSRGARCLTRRPSRECARWFSTSKPCPIPSSGGACTGSRTCPMNRSAQIMFTKRRQETGSEFLSHEQHRVVAISVVMRSRDSLKVWSLGEEGSSEKDLIERFFDGLDKFTPELVSWNGAGFDLPVLHYRSLLHSITAARYWETGDGDVELPLQQLLEPVPLAAHGSHGYFVGIPGPRARQFAGCRLPARASRASSACTAPRSGKCSSRAGSSASAIIARPTCSTPI